MGGKTSKSKNNKKESGVIIVEVKVYFGIVIFAIGLVIGDYIVTELKKRFVVIPTDIRKIYKNIDSICTRHLVHLDSTLNTQRRKWLDDTTTEEIMVGISSEIYEGMSENFKRYCYYCITDDELLLCITNNVTGYMLNKQQKINKKIKTK